MINSTDTFVFRRIHPVSQRISNGRASIQQLTDLVGASIEIPSPQSSLPSGGTVGQVLTKNSSVDFDASWATPSGGGGGESATNLTYTASTRTLNSSTGTGTTLPLFTVSDAGLAPASGGGTTNFLRADGTWAVPSATNLTYTASTRTLNSSTGTGTTLPLFTVSGDGLAPASGGGTTNFLRADGTWAVPPAGLDAEAVRAMPLTGFVTSSPVPVGATDTLLQAFQKIQASLNTLPVEGGIPIERYGAIGDGVFDCTAAIATAAAAGGTVFFAPGKTYMVNNGTIVITQPNTRWLGKGTIKFFPAQTGLDPKIEILEAATDCYMEVTFDGSFATQTYTYNGLWEIDCFAPRFKYVGKMFNVSSGGIRLFSSAHDAQFIGCDVDNVPDNFVTGYNFPLTTGPNGGIIAYCTFNGTGASARNGSNWLVIGNKGRIFNSRTAIAGNNAGGGFTIFDTNGTSFDNQAIGNEFDCEGVLHGFGLSMTGARNTVIGNTIRNATAIGIECFDGVCADNTTIDCQQGYSASQGTVSTSLSMSNNTNLYSQSRLCNVTNAVWSNTNGGQATITLTGNLGFLIGANARYDSSGNIVYGAPNSITADVVTLFSIVSSGGTGVGFNGNFNTVSCSYNSGTNTTTLIVAMPSASSVGTYTSGGKVVPVARGYTVQGTSASVLMPHVDFSNNKSIGPIGGGGLQNIANLSFKNNKAHIDGVITTGFDVYTAPTVVASENEIKYVNQPTVSNTQYALNIIDCLAGQVSSNTVIADPQVFGAIQVNVTSGSNIRTHIFDNHVRAQSRGISTNNNAAIYVRENRGVVTAGILWDVGVLVNQFNNVTFGAVASIESTMRIATSNPDGFIQRGNTANVFRHTGSSGAYFDFNTGGATAFVHFRNGSAFAKWFECDGNNSTSFAGNFLSPITDNSTQLGASGNRWSSVWAVNGTIQTSDKREKDHVDFVDPTQALEFIGRVDPAFFRWKVGSIDRVLVEDAVIEQTLVREEYTDIEGNLVPAQYDTKLIKEAVYEERPKAGKRVHAGFYAQDVKAAMDEMGIDWAAWGLDDVSDPESRQNMRVQQLIPILWAAVQGLQQRIANLESDTSATVGS